MWNSIRSIRKDDWFCNHDVHVRSEPVIEVLSVTLRTNQYDDSPSKSSKESRGLYGSIYVHEGGEGMGFCVLFKRSYGVDEPDIIPLVGGVLSLTTSSVMSMDKPVIEIDIQDSVTRETIVNGSAPLLMTTTDTDEQHHNFEQFHKITIPGTACSAEVEYLALTFGVFATVSVQLIKQQVMGSGNNEQEGEEKDLDVYGTVSATYNLYHSKNKVNHINLFEIKEDSDKSSKVRLESPLTLSRSVVAVPAYSSLMIQVDLWDRSRNKLIVQGCCKFETRNLFLESDMIIPGLNCLNAKVTFVWREPFLLDEPDFKQEELRLWSSKSFNFLPNPGMVIACHVAEVFSVFIGRESDEQLSLHGMVNFLGFSFVNLFERDRTDPYILSSGCNLLPLKGSKHALVPGDTFFLYVDLEDVEGRVSIKGVVRSSFGIDHHMSPWHDRLLCSIVKGADEHSFAAVHFTVFSYAVEAILNMRLLFNGEHSADACCKIHGSIVARYRNYGCRTSYEKLYYRCVLFERPEENPLEMPCKDFDMKLSRSVVAVPCDSSLLIAVDLSYQSSGITRPLRDSWEFKVGTGVDSGVTIWRDEVGINITMEWRAA